MVRHVPEGPDALTVGVGLVRAKFGPGRPGSLSEIHLREWVIRGRQQHQCKTPQFCHLVRSVRTWWNEQPTITVLDQLIILYGYDHFSPGMATLEVANSFSALP